MSQSQYDLIGNPLTDDELQILDVYRRLDALAAREDLAPCAEANVKHALAALWQVVTDLNIQYRPETLGDA